MIDFFDVSKINALTKRDVRLKIINIIKNSKNRVTKGKHLILLLIITVEY